MPNLYYSTPSMPFASAAQGFLANLKDFQQLDLQRQAMELRTQDDAESRRIRSRALDLQERGLDLEEMEEMRLAQGPQYPPELVGAALEELDLVAGGMPTAGSLRVAVEHKVLDPVDAIVMAKKWRESDIGNEWKQAELSRVKSTLPALIDETFPVGHPKREELQKAIIDAVKYPGRVQPIRLEQMILGEIAAEQMRQSAPQGTNEGSPFWNQMQDTMQGMFPEGQATTGQPQAQTSPAGDWVAANQDQFAVMNAEVQQAKTEDDFNRILNSAGGADIPDEVVDVLVQRFASNPHNQLKMAKAKLAELKKLKGSLSTGGLSSRKVRELEQQIQMLESYVSPQESLKGIK